MGSVSACTGVMEVRPFALVTLLRRSGWMLDVVRPLKRVSERGTVVEKGADMAGKALAGRFAGVGRRCEWKDEAGRLRKARCAVSLGLSAMVLRWVLVFVDNGLAEGVQREWTGRITRLETSWRSMLWFCRGNSAVLAQTCGWTKGGFFFLPQDTAASWRR